MTNRNRLAALAVSATVWLLSDVPHAKSDILFVENFENSSGLTIAGDFEAPWIQWGIAPLSGTATYPSNFIQGGAQSGNIFYAAMVKESDPAGAATVTMTLPELTGYTDLELTVSLAAADGNVWESTHRDSLHIIGSTSTTPPLVPNIGAGFMPVPNSIDNFLPPLRGADLQSAVHSSFLGVQFQDFVYPIANNLQSLTFAAGSTGGDETVGIDSVMITGTAIPEPSAFTFCCVVGICALIGLRPSKVL